MNVVTDSSVAIKWYVSEIHADSAEKLLLSPFRLHAPELILPEFGSIVWKKIRRNLISKSEGSAMIDAFRKSSINLHSHAGIFEAAYTGAIISGQTVYDWTYVALAVSLSCPFVTADERLFQNLATTPIRKSLIWIEDF